MTEVRDRGYARLELIFDDCTKANRCLEDKDSQEMVFEIPGRAKTCKGVITGWDLECTLDELIDAMVNSTGVVSVERLMRKRYDRESKKVEVSASHVVAMTWEGSELQSEIKIYEGLLGLRARPFINSVLQCFCCFKFGHLTKHCKRRPVCKVCGEDFQGRCDREYRCSNCGGRHMPTNRRCELMNIINTHLKKVMAIENVNVKEAKETLLNRQINSRVSARLDRSIVSNERAILINHAEKGQIYESINNYINKSETLKKLGDDN